VSLSFQAREILAFEFERHPDFVIQCCTQSASNAYQLHASGESLSQALGSLPSQQTPGVRRGRSEDCSPVAHLCATSVVIRFDCCLILK
jgi:hypothetical protein